VTCHHSNSILSLTNHKPSPRVQRHCSNLWAAGPRYYLHTMSKRQLPLLDISLYHREPQIFVEQLRSACHNVGFFLLKHDLPPGLSQLMLKESQDFFARPMEEKMQISYRDSRSFRGYMPLGVENTQGKLDAREQIEYAVEYPQQDQLWPAYERLKDINPWPTNFQPSLQVTTLEYSKHVCLIADCLRDALCLALGLDPSRLSRLFKHDDEKMEVPHWVLKLISYPPVVKDNQKHQQGVGAHTDTNFMTLILQDTVGGLQAFSQGEWFDVSTDDDSVLVCNLGEQAEIWSRGYFLATPHRVLANNKSNRNRISIPLFYNPVLSAKIEPIREEEISTSNWERDFDEKQHWRRNNNIMLNSVGDNTFKSLARSHPEVFRRHHPDLQLTEDGRIIPKE
jgi:isopenicillin N synthase-like dioxygenase